MRDLENAFKEPDDAMQSKDRKAMEKAFCKTDVVTAQPGGQNAEGDLLFLATHPKFKHKLGYL